MAKDKTKKVFEESEGWAFNRVGHEDVRYKIDENYTVFRTLPYT